MLYSFLQGHSRAQDRVEARKRQIKEAQIEARFADVKEDVEPADVLEKKLQVSIASDLPWSADTTKLNLLITVYLFFRWKDKRRWLGLLKSGKKMKKE